MCISLPDCFLKVNLPLTPDGRPEPWYGLELIHGGSQIKHSSKKTDLWLKKPPIREDGNQQRVKIEFVTKTYVIPFVFFSTLAVPGQNPELSLPDYPNWQDPPSRVCMGMCGLGHTHMYACVCVYVCARTNPKQVSVISPVEAQAHRELIIHTVTLFTVALILQSLRLPAFFQSPEA